MSPFPLHLIELIGKPGEIMVYFIVGLLFGYVLEISGFAVSTKLAGQFYLRDMTVLKVMFSAIVVAMVLIFLASGLGLLDYNLIWVNPTYLWPGIVGGLIMGVGFIVGGFCPGTSLVAVSTFKIDGIFFAVGTLLGVFMFGETVEKFDVFWNSSYFGRLTIPDWLGISTGIVVLLIILMAVFMFWGAEKLEKFFGGRDLRKEPKVRYAAAGGLVFLSVALVFIGQPTNADRWSRLEPEKMELIETRAVYIEPAELLSTIHEHKINLVMLDVRDEADFNLFHLDDAIHVEPSQLSAKVKSLLLEPANTVFVVMSNDETGSTEAWKFLVAESLPNVYILEGGINNWLRTFSEGDERIQPIQSAQDEQYQFMFSAALGSGFPASLPNPEHYKSLEFTPKIKLSTNRAPKSGGCG
jgi:rhodanese-related sulfurtransferase